MFGGKQLFVTVSHLEKSLCAQIRKNQEKFGISLMKALKVLSNTDKMGNCHALK